MGKNGLGLKQNADLSLKSIFGIQNLHGWILEQKLIPNRNLQKNPLSFEL